jgi:hypothetical protein
MMQTMDCNEARISLGVYVLGAIDPAERSLVDAHLATCQECRDELADLAGLPALLARVGKDEALRLGGDAAPLPPAEPAPEPPPELLGTVLDLTAARRRRRTWRNTLTAAAAVVVIAAGSFTGAHFLTSSSGISHDPGAAMGGWERLTGTNRTGQEVTVDYEPMMWGMQLDSKVVGIPVNTTCQLIAITSDGKQHVVSMWTTDDAENTVWYSGGTSITEQQVKKFEVTTGGKTPPVYITVPPGS